MVKMYKQSSQNSLNDFYERNSDLDVCKKLQADYHSEEPHASRRFN